VRIKQILFILFVFLIVSAHVTFAADFTVTGKIIDSNNNPIPQSVIVFINSEGKTTVAATADLSGLYTVVIPDGTYSISVSGPKGSGIQETTLTGRTISSNSNIDFTLKAPVVKEAQKTTGNSNFLPFVMVGVIVLILIALGGYIFWNKRKVKPLS
jgi:LPXTG-motif cell wall-anchored protein